MLIVEDEQALRELLMRKFEETGRYEVLGAQDGVQALDSAMMEKPDAIVLDMEMPNLDGEGFLKKLQQNFKGTFPHVIVLTNTESATKIANVMQYGAHDYLIKAESPLSAVVESVNKRVFGT